MLCLGNLKADNFRQHFFQQFVCDFFLCQYDNATLHKASSLNKYFPQFGVEELDLTNALQDERAKISERVETVITAKAGLNPY